MGNSKKVKRSITVKGLLRYLNDEMELFFDVSRKSVYRRFFNGGKEICWDDYFPAVVMKAANRLERRGLAVKIETAQGVIVKISDRGKKEVLKYKLEEFKPKTGNWDGKWRLVFFDVSTKNNRKRDQLRLYLKNLGMKQMQGSVWVSPYDVFSEVRYLREIIEVPHVIKLAEVSYLENSEELKEIFGIK